MKNFSMAIGFINKRSVGFEELETLDIQEVEEHVMGICLNSRINEMI